VEKLNYALLLQDQSEEDQIVYTLRNLGAQVKTHRSLNEIWESLFSVAPASVIVDIRLLNSESKFLKNHPMIMSGSIPLIIFYRDSDSPIMRNISDENFYEELKLSSSYEKPLKIIHKRLLRSTEIEVSKAEIEQKLHAREKEVLVLKEKLYNSKSEEIIKTVAYLLTRRFYYNQKLVRNFIGALAKTIEDFSFIERMILFEINHSKQRIKTVNISNKSKNIPSLRIEEVLTDSYFKGYMLKACESAAFDEFGHNSVIIRIDELPGRTKYFMALKVESKYINHVDTNYLSNILSSELQKSASCLSSKLLIKSVYEIFPLADRIRKNLDHRKVIYHIDLSSLRESIDSVEEFQWESFFNELLEGLIISLGGDNILYVNGISGVFFAVDYSFDTKEISLYLDSLKVWSYFESDESSLGKMIELKLEKLNLKQDSIECMLLFKRKTDNRVKNFTNRENVDVF